MNTALYSISAGPALPAEDQRDEFDIESYLLNSHTQNFYIIVNGDSMEDHGIHDGDILVVDKLAPPRQGSVVIAQIGAEFTIKQYDTSTGRLRLVPANCAYSPVDPFEGSVLCGVATFVIHRL